MMNRLKVKIASEKSFAYPIQIAANLLKQPKKWLPKTAAVHCVVIITDHHIKNAYGHELAQALKKQGHKVLLLSFARGEKSKIQKTKQYLEKQMLLQHCGRDTLIVALGGGVVGDLAGFTAATYMRGIPYIQVPTTLLAMVDSSVGGKTGIDTPQGKNLIGAFWQPQAVIADINCLSTLPKNHLINGLIEALKMFLTNDAHSFHYLNDHLDKILKRDKKFLQTIIYHAVKIKAHVVGEDAKENHQRKILNFGHTIGHAIEQMSRYKILHGYAVAFGILVEAKISQLLGLLSAEHYELIQTIFSRLGFDGADLHRFDIQKIIQGTKVDKKVRMGQAHYVLLKQVGKVHVVDKMFAHPVTDDIVKKAFSAVIKGDL